MMNNYVITNKLPSPYTLYDFKSILTLMIVLSTHNAHELIKCNTCILKP